jgi:hypothetical protein
MRIYFILILGLILLLCAGTCNLYPLYLKLLAEKYNFSINQINFFGTCINIGLWFAFPAGILYDKYGPRISLFIAFICLPGSYMILHYLLNSDKFLDIPFFFFALLAILLGQGSSICYTTVMTINVNNFKFKDSSLIVSMLAVNMSLGPSLFAFYKENISFISNKNFYFLLSIFLGLLILSCLFLFKRFDIDVESSDINSLKSLEKYRVNKLVKTVYRLNSLLCICFIFSIFLNNYGIIISRNFNLFLFPLLICFQFLSLLCLFKRYHNDDFEKEYVSQYEDKIKDLRNKNNENNFEKNLKKNKNLKDLELIYIPNFENKSSKKNPKQKSLFSIQEESGKNISKNLVDYENDEYNKQSIEIYMSESIQDNFIIINHDNSKSNSENQMPKILLIQKDDYNQQYNFKYITLMFLILFFGMGSVISNFNNMNYIVDTLYFMNFDNSEIKNDTQFIFRFLEYSNNYNNLNVINNSTNKANYNKYNLNISHQIIDWNNMFNVSNNKNQDIINMTITNFTIKNISNLDNNTNNLDLIKKHDAELEVIETNNLMIIIKNKIFFYVIIYFTSNAITRLFSNFLLEFLIRKDCMFYHLLITNILGLISQILGLLMNKDLFIFIISLCGSCHGFFMTFIPIYVKKYFLPKNFGFILGIFTSGAALGSLINSNFLFVYSYQRFGILLNEKSLFQVCREYQCFSYSYFLNSFFFFINIFISLFFIIRNNKNNKIN